MLKKLFSKKESKTYGPTEPIYPGELFEVAELRDNDIFLGLSSINKSYDNYPNKKYFPWWIQVTIELVDIDEKQIPTESESKLLNDLENQIEEFISTKHKTHFLGHLTQDGFRDIIFYVQEPRFSQEETNTFFDQIQQKRRVNFKMEKDIEWKNVSRFIR